MPFCDCLYSQFPRNANPGPVIVGYRCIMSADTSVLHPARVSLEIVHSTLGTADTYSMFPGDKNGRGWLWMDSERNTGSSGKLTRDRCPGAHKAQKLLVRSQGEGSQNWMYQRATECSLGVSGVKNPSSTWKEKLRPNMSSTLIYSNVIWNAKHVTILDCKKKISVWKSAAHIALHFQQRGGVSLCMNY